MADKKRYNQNAVVQPLLTGKFLAYHHYFQFLIKLIYSNESMKRSVEDEKLSISD